MPATKSQRHAEVPVMIIVWCFPGGARGTRTPGPLLAEVVAAAGGPAAAQVRGLPVAP